MIFTTRSAVLATFVLSSFAVVVVSAGDYCRCEAEFERFYDDRRLQEQNRILETGQHSSYTNDDGYYVVDGIVVLPKDSDECSAFPDVATRAANIEYFMSRFGKHRDLWDEEDADDDEDFYDEDEIEDEMETEAKFERNLKGSSKGSKGGKGESGSYYYGGKGKGKVRFDGTQFLRPRRFLALSW